MKKRIVLCPACGVEMELKLEDFSIGADGGGGLMTLLADTYEVDLYACSKCGRLELYTSGFEPAEKRGTEEDEEEQNGQTSGVFFGFGKKKDKRPPWEK